MVLQTEPEQRQRYENALQSLVEKVKQDPYVLAAILVGSLSYDVVWEKSDIDLMLIVQETKQKPGGFSLVEDGINIHASTITRGEFKRTVEGSVQSSFMHSMLMKGRVLFSRDETIDELYENRRHLGARDRENRLLAASVGVLWTLPKAQKWLLVKHDRHYSFCWILRCVESLAAIELLMQGEITDREVLPKALRHNPAFFRVVYIDLIDGPKTDDALLSALRHIEQYLHERVHVIFKPVFDYLVEVGGVRSAHEISHDFQKQWNVNSADMACEWLADEGYIQKVSTPIRLTEKSRVDVEEAAYYYAGEE